MGDRRYIIAEHARLKVDGVDVGYTLAPTTISITRDYVEANVEQVKGPIKEFLTNEVMTIETTLAETTMENLRIVWDQESSMLVGGTFLALGTEGGANEHTIVINANAPEGEDYDYENWYIFKAVSMEAGQITRAKGEVSGIPVTFRCLKDTSNGNRFGYRKLSDSEL